MKRLQLSASILECSIIIIIINLSNETAKMGEHKYNVTFVSRAHNRADLDI